MTPAAIIRDAQTDGVSLTLSPSGTIKATGNGAAVSRWLPLIREYKAAIMEMLKGDPVDSATTSWGWRVTYPKDHLGDRFSGRAFECYIVPLQTLAEVRVIHPGARIEPIPEQTE